jgi:hypothetical protein
MKTKNIVAISALVLLVGCMPLKQITWHSSTDEIRISPESAQIHVNILATTDNPTNKPTIDTERSFAISPSGRRYTLQVTKNEYSNKYTSRWTADYVALIDPTNNRRHKWENGEWKLHLFFTGPISRKPIESKFKLWTFWYCPIIHGPPN